jgi:hypothetical protein
LRLSEFINQQREPIMVEWETFARRLGATTETMDGDLLASRAVVSAAASPSNAVG